MHLCKVISIIVLRNIISDCQICKTKDGIFVFDSPENVKAMHSPIIIVYKDSPGCSMHLNAIIG